MKHLSFGLTVFLLLSNLAGTAFSATPMRVTFLNPGAPGDAFFDMMTEFMQAAADDFGIALEVIYCDRDHLKMQEEGERILSRKRLPEYLILINEKNAAPNLLATASERGVKVALINEGLQPADSSRYGGPGRVHENWILEVLPDDEQAGYMLAKALLDAARERGMGDGDGFVQLVGIAGTFQTGSSTKRVNGLRKAVAEDGRAVLLQVAPAYWEEARAKRVSQRLLNRYPLTNVIWSASDLMARGGFSGAQYQNRQVVTGGIDWAEFALQEVKDGRFVATVGGHFMDGGWALVMLYDLHNELVLSDRRVLTRFSLINGDNVDAYLSHFGSHDWSVIDFTRFSRKLNPELDQYDFGLSAVMNQLQQ